MHFHGSTYLIPAEPTPWGGPVTFAYFIWETCSLKCNCFFMFVVVTEAHGHKKKLNLGCGSHGLMANINMPILWRQKS